MVAECVPSMMRELRLMQLLKCEMKGELSGRNEVNRTF